MTKQPPPSLRIDLHTHTNASFDSWLTPERYVETAVREGLGAVAITDHNAIEGALAVRDLDPPFEVIVGEEILTTDGEVIGLYLDERIPPSLSAAETIDRIHDQGGLAMLPHPFARYAIDRFHAAAVQQFALRVDLIEVVNARNRSVDDARAARLARRIGVPGAAGSDSHMTLEMGRGFQFVRPFVGPADLVAALADSKPLLRCRTPVYVSGICVVYSICAVYTGRAEGPPRTAGADKRFHPAD